MDTYSIFNDVLGPVMRGPSSSHTAASFRIGALARALLGDDPASATFTFDPGGSFGQVYHEQSSDLAASQGLRLVFAVEPLPMADHPNTVVIQLASQRGQTMNLVARSIGGGAVILSEIEGWPVHLVGDAHDVLVIADRAAVTAITELLGQDGQLIESPRTQTQGSQILIHARRQIALVDDVLNRIRVLPSVQRVWTAPPVLYVQRGKPLFSSAAQMIALAAERRCSLGQIALAYEAALLGLPESEILAETIRRFEVMRAAVHWGLGDKLPPMQLLQPSARQIHQAEAEGHLPIGGLHTRAAARAMAVMHVNSSSGVVCAAPTAGSAGTLPGVVVTLAEEKHLPQETIALSLLAASAVGLIVALRATFAAEVAGCQVEIGAAGAMGATAVVEAAGGTARQACDAAAIAFQNTMGSVCDLVQGIVEIPCHTRNATAASSAFVCADLILGGYANPIPLDETIDAVYAVGKMLPRELKVTALGGLAITPSALAMPRIRDE
jgi:L-serine dehydratase